MKALALRSIGFVLLAIFSIGLLIALTGGPIRKMGISVFCYTYKTFSPLVPEMEMPPFCENNMCYIKMETIDADTPSELATYIAAYAISCYTSGGTSCQEKNNISICYELHINKPFRITEKDVTKIMEQDYEHGCMLLENSKIAVNGVIKDYPGECGDEDKILWLLEGGEKLITISYDLKNKRIIIR